MVIYYDDDSTIILENGMVGRTGNWYNHCAICGENSELSICSDECLEEAYEILSQIREVEYQNELLYDLQVDNELKASDLKKRLRVSYEFSIGAIG